MQTQTKRSLLLVLFIVGVHLWIFSNSIPDIQTSSAESEKVIEIVESILTPIQQSLPEPLVGKGNVTAHLVRKLAHFTEFCILGVLYGIFFRKIRSLPLLLLILAGLCDETIQIFSGRGAMVADIWIDVAGGVVGFCVAVFIWKLCGYLRRRCR